MGCPSSCIKITLYILNFFMLLFGIFYIALATFSLNNSPALFVIYLFISGGLTFIIALFGCCAICQENICMTTTYVCLLLFSLISQIIGTIWGIDEEAIKKSAADDVGKTWLKEIQNPGAMDNTQNTYKCCGKYGPNDYININRLRYPISCYEAGIVNPANLLSNGCVAEAEKLFTLLFSRSVQGQWGSVVFTALMLGFAVYLLRRFRRKQIYNYKIEI